MTAPPEMPPESPDRAFVGRGGHKLAHALYAFAIDPAGLTCADFGCHVGGFTDCLLQAGAAYIHAVDTGYGILDYRLRTDERVAVHERTNILRTEAPQGGVDLVVMDVGWTPLRLAIPAALTWLKQTPHARIIALLKPHYEAAKLPGEGKPTGGVLQPGEAERITRLVLDELPSVGVDVLACARSPIAGGGSRRKAPGNAEFLVLLRPISET